MDRPAFGERAARVVSILVVFHFVCLAWIFFRAEDFEVAWLYLAGFGAGWADGVQQAGPLMVALIALGLAGQFIPDRLFERATGVLERMPVWGLGADRRHRRRRHQRARPGRGRAIHLFPVLIRGMVAVENHVSPARLEPTISADAIPMRLRRRGASPRQVLAMTLIGAGAGGIRVARPGDLARPVRGGPVLEPLQQAATQWDGAMDRLGLTRPHDALRAAMRRSLDWQW